MPKDYLQNVRQLAEDALFQAGVVTRCQHHHDVIRYTGDIQSENTASNLAGIWIRQEVGTFDRLDLRDAIKGLLDGAIRGDCPECGPAQKKR